jgi:hypothetical protein
MTWQFGYTGFRTVYCTPAIISGAVSANERCDQLSAVLRQGFGELPSCRDFALKNRSLQEFPHLK